MRIFFIATLVLINLILIYYFLRPQFKSAFEADQQCHYEILSNIDNSSGLGCDHDMETRQWIMFDNSDSNHPAKVLQRFRY